VVHGKTVALVLPGATRIEGTLTAVRPDALSIDVKMPERAGIGAPQGRQKPGIEAAQSRSRSNDARNDALGIAAIAIGTGIVIGLPTSRAETTVIRIAD
jgi:hypothetical protein